MGLAEFLFEDAASDFPAADRREEAFEREKDRSHELRLSGSISTATVTSLPTNAHLCWAIFTIERKAKPPFVVWARLNDAQV
jgi:hypothetical protein